MSAGTCQGCGQPMAATDGFCRLCGAPKPSMGTARVGGQNYCGGCGAPLFAIDGACGGCGTPVLASAQEHPPPAPDVLVKLPKMRGPTLIVVAVAVLAVLWPIGLWIAAAREESSAAAAPDTQSEPVAAKAAGPVGPSSCKSDTLAFAIKIPRSWAEATSDNADCTRFAVPVGTAGGGVLQITPDAGTFDVAQVQGDVITERKGNVSGRPATYYEATFTDQAGSYRAFGYILDHGGRAFNVGLVTPDGVILPSSTKKAFTEVVRRITFKD